MPEPRHQEEYEGRQTIAARRVLIDMGQVLAAFRTQMVIVGGWVPELGFEPQHEAPHVGSIDVDLALDIQKLSENAYAEMIDLLLNTGRYRQGRRPFQLIATVDLKDGDAPVEVEVDFLAPPGDFRKHKPKLVENFRVLQFPACEVAFVAPRNITVSGAMMSGATNQVELLVPATADYLIMKAHAIDGRDKPKDVYDLCFALERSPEGRAAMAEIWRERSGEKLVEKAVRILKTKFESPQHFGPMALAEFHNAQDDDERDLYARRAYELVRDFLERLEVSRQPG